MSTSPHLPSQNPFEAARLSLINRLLTWKVPKAYPGFPSPSDHQSVARMVLEAAQEFDEWLADVGSVVRDNATGHISADLFSGSFTAAIDGNETYAIETQGEQLREYASERRGARGGW